MTTENVPAVVEGRSDKSPRRESLKKKAAIRKFLELLNDGVTKTDAYRTAFNTNARRACERANELLRRPDVQELQMMIKKRMAEEIAQRNAWSQEQAITTLKEAIQIGMDNMRRRISMPAVVAVTNAVQELNKMTGLTGKDLQVAQQLVIFQGEEKLKD